MKALFLLQVDQELRGYGAATELTGSTATIVLLKHGTVVCANLGDSRAIASVNGTVKVITSDHNTSNPKERERVHAMGGVIKENRQGCSALKVNCMLNKMRVAL